ncbi:ufm1-specific protease 2 [Eurytemora carolleeae]|uniref:ufm1-specific protease 2 n=1 Tax=Eurytemora carolleeae TaxID=1294199 RepID=UPI000C76DCB2|nr:ufm1-specific protease 2 [Eurytemora carolleeae]XP_023346566.1 ufm1-specific protease 2 [Eurytemora carolleeae]XP_023346567.1 ufm1-specific protease 2 [Eurytemora carolleeae]|eukprot:XP_023346565.1 ufm1-specific protease 2-like [Eurytemora affinis]
MVVSRLRILDSLHKRLLSNLAQEYTGALYGLQLNDESVAVAAAGQNDAGRTGDGKKDLELLNEMLPCGIEPTGVFVCTETGGVDEGLELINQLPTPPKEDQVPMCILKQAGTLKAYQFIQGEPVEADLVVMGESEFKEQTVTIRVRGKMDLTCGLTKPEIAIGFKHLIEKVTCPYGSYVLDGEQVIFLHRFIEKGLGTGWANQAGQLTQEDEEDCEIVGPVGEDSVVDDLWQFTQTPEEDDGFGSGSVKRKKVERKDRLEFNLLWNLTNPACTSRTIGCAPIIHYEKKEAKTISVPVCIDALGLVPANSKSKDLMDVLKGCVARQIGDIAASVLSEYSVQKRVSTPQVFHFKPDGLPHFITIIYPTAANNTIFEDYRKSIHASFMLPMDRPVFRKANAWQWPDPSSKDKLMNVHSTILEKHGVQGGQVATVQGVYTYYHYMQDEFDDDGWGCAYRSLQTLISWFKHQGYTDTRIPTHREIQKCLVDIGDKEAKFIGSKQWIGSTEVGFVLETSCSIQSRFISVSSGAELASRTRDLIAHFESEGSPVMIGGGVYAHTILGVAWDEKTDNCSWLILDPHYTGSDDLKTILAKGWCGWKGAKFWNQTAFYNMCLPQRPKNVI